MRDPHFFGYGSLVNRQTHDYPDVRHARVRGWRRVWRGTSLREVAYLTVAPCSQSEISGLIAAVPGADWAALDERERAYVRHPVAALDHGHTDEPEVQIYAIEEAHRDGVQHPILLSYLDTVIQGYLVEFGEVGAKAFFESTKGWHLPILDDRAAPIYPRATLLSVSERSFVDEHLALAAENAL